MRKLRSYQIPGANVQKVLDEFNERQHEFGIEEESDVVSVSALPATRPQGSVDATVEVVIVYWSAE